MSKIGVSKKNLEIEEQAKKVNGNYQKIIRQNHLLTKEKQTLLNENKILKNLIIEYLKKKEIFSLNPSVKNESVKKVVYFQIILGILVIVLSLGFHILYLSVADCLLFNNGSPGCWIKSWLGINIHASFFLDILLYSLIAIQILLIVLIVKNHIAKI